MSEINKLRAFAQAILDDFPDSAPDGFEIQELAEQHGLLEPVEVTKPCHDEFCSCAEVGDFPMQCYRKTKLLTGEL
jgi:hypothetical protein